MLAVTLTLTFVFVFINLHKATDVDSVDKHSLMSPWPELQCCGRPLSHWFGICVTVQEQLCLQLLTKMFFLFFVFLNQQMLISSCSPPNLSIYIKKQTLSEVLGVCSWTKPWRTWTSTPLRQRRWFKEYSCKWETDDDAPPPQVTNDIKTEVKNWGFRPSSVVGGGDGWQKVCSRSWRWSFTAWLSGLGST